VGRVGRTVPWSTPDRRWIRALLVVALPGVVLVLLHLPPAAIFAVGSLAYLLAVTALHACGTHQQPTARSGRGAARVGAQLAFIFMGLVGYLSASVGLALLVVAAVVLTRPLLTRVTRMTPPQDTDDSPRSSGPDPFGRVTSEPDAAVLRLPAAAHVGALSDAELCLEWRRSFTVLQAAESALHRARVVDVRQALLDEMERRNPSALRSWLTSGARAASGPDRFLVTASGDDEDRPDRA
jgi:hypothetical protein